uniref:Uncharacterized protein n=1 Tax=Trypanosoma vivax (strain Y486) TaxID=1055687 RepID=G0UBJ7_TRYVY|nr:conserved hypothetical protein [Trypanosoma vivax Y486]
MPSSATCSRAMQRPCARSRAITNDATRSSTRSDAKIASASQRSTALFRTDEHTHNNFLELIRPHRSVQRHKEKAWQSDGAFLQNRPLRDNTVAAESVGLWRPRDSTNLEMESECSLGCGARGAQRGPASGASHTSVISVQHDGGTQSCSLLKGRCLHLKPASSSERVSDFTCVTDTHADVLRRLEEEHRRRYQRAAYALQRRHPDPWWRLQSAGEYDARAPHLFACGGNVVFSRVKKEVIDDGLQWFAV